MSNIVIVERPGTIKLFQNVLGEKYVIMASKNVGHNDIYFENLVKKKMMKSYDKIQIEMENNKIIDDLKLITNDAEMVYLASDGDEEGDNIAKSLINILSLKKYKRMRVNEMTHDSITHAFNTSSNLF